MCTEEMNPTRLQMLMVKILSLLDRDIGSIEFAKLLYLVDVESIRLRNFSIFGQEYIRYPKGPVPKDFFEDKECLEGFEIEQEIGISGGKSGMIKNSHHIGNDMRFSPSFDEVEETIIRKAISKLKAFTPIMLEDLSYKTEPMRALTEKEQEASELKIGELLDLKLIIPNKRMELWRNKTKKTILPDQEYIEFFEKERKEFLEILSS